MQGCGCRVQDLGFGTDRTALLSRAPPRHSCSTTSPIQLFWGGRVDERFGSSHLTRSSAEASQFPREHANNPLRNQEASGIQIILIPSPTTSNVARWVSGKTVFDAPCVDGRACIDPTMRHVWTLHPEPSSLQGNLAHTKKHPPLGQP